MKKVLLAMLALPLMFLLVAMPAYAASCNSGNVTSFKNSANRCLNQSGDTSDKNTLMIMVKDVINILLFVAGIIAVIFIVVGGFRFVTSEGDANKASQAKRNILYAVIGLVIAASSYTIVGFVLGQL